MHRLILITSVILSLIVHQACPAVLEGQDAQPEYLFSTHIIHVTNPEEFLNGAGRVKINLRVNGPFVYNVKVEKSNIAGNSNGTVSFLSKKTYTFNAPQSIAKDDQALFTVPNVPFFNLLNSKDLSSTQVERLILESNSSPFVLKTVQELLWGYEDPLLKLMKERGLHRGSTNFGILKDDAEIEGVKLTVGSSSGSINKGSSYDKIQFYNGNSRFSTWGNEFCDRINGTDFMDADVRLDFKELEPLYFLSSQFCRPMKFLLVGNETDSEGNVEFLRFQPDKDFFRTRNSPNKCFCSDDGCPPEGTLDISKCKSGLTLSNPYFESAETSVRMNFDTSFEPHSDENYVEVEKETGKISSMKLSMQWNVQMKQIPNHPLTRNFRRVLLPLVQVSNIIRKPAAPEDDDDENQELDSSEEIPEPLAQLSRPDVSDKVKKKIIKKLTKGKKKKNSGQTLMQTQWMMAAVVLTTVLSRIFV